MPATSWLQLDMESIALFRELCDLRQWDEDTAWDKVLSTCRTLNFEDPTDGITFLHESAKTYARQKP